MNIALGLKRLAAAFFGLIALVFSIMAISEPSTKGMTVGVGAVLICYALFRLVCWIIDGFTKR